MNCLRQDEPLAVGAAFCPNCGQPIVNSSSRHSSPPYPPRKWVTVVGVLLTLTGYGTVFGIPVERAVAGQAPENGAVAPTGVVTTSKSTRQTVVVRTPSGGACNLRSAPNIKSACVNDMPIPDGSCLQVLSTSGDWMQVQETLGPVGWVRWRYGKQRYLWPVSSPSTLRKGFTLEAVKRADLDGDGRAELIYIGCGKPDPTSEYDKSRPACFVIEKGGKVVWKDDTEVLDVSIRIQDITGDKKPEAIFQYGAGNSTWVDMVTCHRGQYERVIQGESAPGHVLTDKKGVYLLFMDDDVYDNRPVDGRFYRWDGSKMVQFAKRTAIAAAGSNEQRLVAEMNRLLKSPIPKRAAVRKAPTVKAHQQPTNDPLTGSIEAIRQVAEKVKRSKENNNFFEGLSYDEMFCLAEISARGMDYARSLEYLREPIVSHDRWSLYHAFRNFHATYERWPPKQLAETERFSEINRLHYDAWRCFSDPNLVKGVERYAKYGDQEQLTKSTTILAEGIVTYLQIPKAIERAQKQYR